MVVLSSTVTTFLVVHETEYAREFIEAEVASFSLPLAEFVFGEPVGQKDIPIFCGEVCFADWTSNLRVRWRIRNFQVRDRVQAVHQIPPCGTKKQSSIPVYLLMNNTGTWSGVSPSLMMSGGMTFH